MKIISWNCNCAFRNKLVLLNDFGADIIIAAESESPQNLSKYDCDMGCESHLWVGRTPSKGLGVYTFNGYKAKLADFYNPSFRYILPLIIRKDRKKFLLLAVWTKGEKDTYNGYVVQACKALNYYQPHIDKNTIISGDFNSNKLWDTHFKREYNHSRLIKLLTQLQFQSVYHSLTQEEYGEESGATIYMYRKPDRPYHIDYTFIHQSKIKKINSFNIGIYDDWINYSDHMPQFLDVA